MASDSTYHGSKSLVNLKDINIILVQAKLAQNLRNSQGGPNAHDPRLQTGNGSTTELADNRLTELLRLRPLHQNQRCRTISDLTGIATGGSTGLPLGESSADLAEGLGGSSVANTIIPVHDDILNLTRLGILDLCLDRHNLILKPTGLLRVLGLLVATSGERIVLLTGDAELCRHILRRLAHGHVVLRGDGVLVDTLGHLGSTAVGVGAHALRTHGDTNIDGACKDLVGDVLDGEQAGRAEAVGYRGGGGYGEAGSQDGGAGDVGGALGETVADADILDEVGVDLGVFADGLA